MSFCKYPSNARNFIWPVHRLSTAGGTSALKAHEHAEQLFAASQPEASQSFQKGSKLSAPRGEEKRAQPTSGSSKWQQPKTGTNADVSDQKKRVGAVSQGYAGGIGQRPAAGRDAA